LVTSLTDELLCPPHSSDDGSSNVELQRVSYNTNNGDSQRNGGQHVNPVFTDDGEPPPVYNGNNGVRDTDVQVTMEAGGKGTAFRASVSSVGSALGFDDTYVDSTGMSLIYSHHEKVPLKNFSNEVRAPLDVQKFLEKTFLLLHLHASNPDKIIDSILKKMLADMDTPTVFDQAKAAVFTHDCMHQLSRTIQGTGVFGGGAIDYDQNWVCAMCTVPSISEARVGIAQLSQPANLGRNCQEVQFVIVILTPTKMKGTKNEFEKARTFGTLFSDIEFRAALSEERTEEGFKELLRSRTAELAQQKHPDASPKGELEDGEKAKIQCGFMKGLIGDLKRRLPHYVSDYVDGVRDKKSISKSLSCTAFLYFACILPCIAFGVLNESNTKGVLNVEKVLYSQTFGGLVFALFGGTPQIVLLTTAPLAIYSKIIYNISSDFDLNFPAMYACVGLWNAFFLVLYSIFDLSILMQFSTRSSEEIFALFISIAFAVDAFKNADGNFQSYYNAPACDGGAASTANSSLATMAANLTANVADNVTSNVTLPEPEVCQREISILYLLLMLGTAWLGVMLFNFTTTPYLNASKRELLADYSLPIAVIIMAFVGAYLFREVDMGKSFDPDARDGALFQVVDFSSLSVGAVFGAMGLGFCLSLLFFMDQNISAALVNAPQNKMKKGTAYHLDLLVIAIVNAVIAVFAFPYVHAALPHSPLHVRALADVEERVDQGHITQIVVRVRETRVTSVLSHVLIGLSIFLMWVLAYIPTPVLYGLFLYVSITALYGNQMFERITLFFTEQSAYPPNHYIRHVPQRKVHIFTLLQMVQLAVLCVFGFVNFSYLKMFFPVLIFLLIPIRHKLIPRLVEKRYLSAIDHAH
ncbi:hypothetical protein BaRGS_00012264, partial [Batillaria attramentaria]